MAEEEVRKRGSSDALVAILELASLSKLVVASPPSTNLNFCQGRVWSRTGEQRMETRIGTNFVVMGWLLIISSEVSITNEMFAQL